MSTNPLVTLIQLSYNNEKYITEAINSVFVQTYQPLQIIISDDCSQDRSLAIIKELVAKYTGPHQVVINQNEQNLGLGDNVNRVMEIAEGELIVESDGDDISYPDRVADTVALWKASGKKYLVMCGESLIVNEAGEPSQKLPKVKPITFDKVLHTEGEQWVYGGSLAWHRSVFELFGPLRVGVVAQDKAIGFRSLLLGKEIGYVEKPVIRYRLHLSNLTNDRTADERLKHKIAMFGSFIQDFDKARSLGFFVGRQDIEKVYREFTVIYSDFVLREQILTSGLVKSLVILMTCGNQLSLQNKKNLFLKKIMGHGNQKPRPFLK